MQTQTPRIETFAIADCRLNVKNQVAEENTNWFFRLLDRLAVSRWAGTGRSAIPVPHTSSVWAQCWVGIPGTQ